jgi:hypothetical protein
MTKGSLDYGGISGPIADAIAALTPGASVAPQWFAGQYLYATPGQDVTLTVSGSKAVRRLYRS